MLFESRDGAFGRVYSVIVGRDEVDVHFVASDVGFDRLVAFVVHDIERRRVSTGVEGCKDVGKAAIIAPSFLVGMARTRIALRS